MSNDTMVTVQGWLAADPVSREVAGHTVTNFRIGCTPRRFHRARQEWVDGETQWYAVSAWRALGANCARSLKRGEPVVVHGRLQHRTYVNNNKVETVALEIEALTVGHDLTRGIDNFLKSPSRQAAPSTADQRVAISEEPVEGPLEEMDGGRSDEPGVPEEQRGEDPFSGVIPRVGDMPGEGVSAA